MRAALHLHCALQVQPARVKEGALRKTPAPILSSVVALAAALLSPSEARSEELPQLSWDKPVVCMRNTKGESVRVQCDLPPHELGGKKTPARCLVAPNSLPGGGGELDKVQSCIYNDDPLAFKKLETSGAKMVRALAETPPGYARSEAGRAFQVKFDLLNRIYLGVSWLPTMERTKTGVPGLSWGRGQAEAGFHISVLSPRGRARHDIKLLEGTMAFGDLELRGLLFSYDYQHLHRRPAFWLTTFIGPPRVYAVNPGVGWGFRLLNVNDRPPAFRDSLDMEFAETHLSWNPWQSNDMFSHLRLEAGADFGKYWEDRGLLADDLGSGSYYVGVTSAVKSRFSLGEGGLHYIFLDVAYLRPRFVSGPLEGRSINRVKATMAYEGIFLAINDQPLSFRFSMTGSSREDVRTGAQGVEGTATVGLRFSFWAPPRIFEPLPELEDP